MYYTFTLRTIGLVLGIALLVTHLAALVRPDAAKRLLARFPRWSAAGILLLTLDGAWYWWVVSVMDLGEFSVWRPTVLIFLPIAYLASLYYLREFLAARALGILMLLAAMPILDAAFMQPPRSRLLVVVLAYLWIVLGMWWTSAPHRLRDCVEWTLASSTRWMLAVTGGAVYGAAVLAFALLRW